MADLTPPTIDARLDAIGRTWFFWRGQAFRECYRHLPMVTEGAFAWTSNAMNLLAFLGLWSIALFTRSELALVAALFQHAYIQVHWLFTEKPDMELLNGD